MPEKYIDNPFITEFRGFNHTYSSHNKCTKASTQPSNLQRKSTGNRMGHPKGFDFKHGSLMMPSVSCLFMKYLWCYICPSQL